MRLGLSLMLVLVLCASPARAGSDATAITPFALEDAADFAKQIEGDLAEQGVRIALVFRAGRARADLPDGIRYTHGAFWVYAEAEAADGEVHRGYAVYNLYHGQENRRRSYLAQDWPLDFTQGDVVGEAGVIIPSTLVQQRLLTLFASGAVEDLHQPDYSLIANPHDARFQNCNEFMLDAIAAALWQTTDREQIKTNLAAHFQPARIRTGLFERMFGPSVDESLRLDDHRGAIRTTTFRAMGDFMMANGYADAVYEIRADHLLTES